MAIRRVESQEMIEQSLLAEFRENREERRRAEAVLKRIRPELLRLFDVEAETEPGRFALDVPEWYRTSFSRQNLNEVLGEVEVTRLVGIIPRTRVRQIDISDRGVPERHSSHFYG